MPISATDDTHTVALYWDFENLHASLYEAKHGDGSYGKPDGRFKVQEPLVDIQAVVEMASSFGAIAINRAYCNWQYCGRYRDALLQNAIELIQLFPPGASAKNGADIKLCLDATEDLARFPHLDTVIIVGGDSDFMPVSQKIKAAGRTLIGLGTRRSTNRHWARSCHEFRYYENLVGDPAEVTGPSPEIDAPAPVQSDPAAEIMKRAMQLLAETRGDAWIDRGAIWPMIKRLDSTFDPRDHGYASFAAMVEGLDALLEMKKGESDSMVRLR